MFEVFACSVGITLDGGVPVMDCEAEVRASPEWHRVEELRLDLRGIPFVLTNSSSTASLEPHLKGHSLVFPLAPNRGWNDALLQFSLSDDRARRTPSEPRLLFFPENVPDLEETRELVESGGEARLTAWTLAVDELIDRAAVLRLSGPKLQPDQAPSTIAAVVAINYLQLTPRVHTTPAYAANSDLERGLAALAGDIERLLDALAELTALPLHNTGIVVAPAADLPHRGPISPLVLPVEAELLQEYPNLSPGQRLWITKSLGALAWRGCCSLVGWRSREISWGLSVGCAVAAASRIEPGGARFMRQHLQSRARWRVRALTSDEERIERRYASIACAVVDDLQKDEGVQRMRFALRVLHGMQRSTDYVSGLLPGLRLGRGQARGSGH